MSKLETAFSKALKEQSPEQQSGQQPERQKSAGQGQGQGGSTPPRKDGKAAALGDKPIASRTGLVLSSRSQIKQMAESRQLTDEELQAKGLIYPRMEDTRLLNIYRNLRTKLLAAAGGRNFTTMVTSVVPVRSTSVIAANIAASFAFDEGKTALLVEGDVHSPTLARLFELEADSRGLMDYLESEENTIRDVIHETGIPRLRFVPSGDGRENAAEYFTSEKMKGAVEEIATRYPDRYPIVDAPSVQDSADARILLDLCDQVVLVVPYGQCTEDQIRTAAEIIGSEKLVGVVLDEF